MKRITIFDTDKSNLENFLKRKYQKEESIIIASNLVKSMPITLDYYRLPKPHNFSLIEDMKETGFSDEEIKNGVPLEEGIRPVARATAILSIPITTALVGIYGIGGTLIFFPNQEWLTGLSSILCVGGLFSTVLAWNYLEHNPTESREERIRKTAQANRFYKTHGKPKKGLEDYTLDSL